MSIPRIRLQPAPQAASTAEILMQVRISPSVTRYLEARGDLPELRLECAARVINQGTALHDVAPALVRRLHAIADQAYRDRSIALFPSLRGQLRVLARDIAQTLRNRERQEPELATAMRNAEVVDSPARLSAGTFVMVPSLANPACWVSGEVFRECALRKVTRHDQAADLRPVYLVMVEGQVHAYAAHQLRQASGRRSYLCLVPRQRQALAVGGSEAEGAR